MENDRVDSNPRIGTQALHADRYPPASAVAAEPAKPTAEELQRRKEAVARAFLWSIRNGKCLKGTE